MSMPGFVFYFRCDICGVNSDDYAVFPFHDVLRPDISLPAWSLIHRCWAQIQMSLSAEHRKKLESDPHSMIALAASLSTNALTVCVPQFRSNNGVPLVTVSPEPICPYCGQVCYAVFGYPPPVECLTAASLLTEDYNAISISEIDLSIRLRNICVELGVVTLGQLREKRGIAAAHSNSTDTVITEIDRWLAMGRSIPGKATKANLS